jgi:hypothetical protein
MFRAFSSHGEDEKYVFLYVVQEVLPFVCCPRSPTVCMSSKKSYRLYVVQEVLYLYVVQEVLPFVCCPRSPTVCLNKKEETSTTEKAKASV